MAPPLAAAPADKADTAVPAGYGAAKAFENCKAQCLAKRDRSSAGRIDPRCQTVCRLLNDTFACYYTTSSCSGRSYLYRGAGNKANRTFERFRVCHERVGDAVRYFDLSTLASDPTGGGDSFPPSAPPRGGDDNAAGDNDGGGGEDPITEAYADERGDASLAGSAVPSSEGVIPEDETTRDRNRGGPSGPQQAWLRFEPFILHVACRSLPSAWRLVRAARASFKNVGVTSSSLPSSSYSPGDGAARPSTRCPLYMVAVWGDEGLDMPLQSPDGRVDLTDVLGPEYLASLVNERHERNWEKMRRFEVAVRELSTDVDADVDEFDGGQEETSPVATRKSFDVVGDVAILNTISAVDPEDRARIGNAILHKNKAIKIVALRTSNLLGVERAPGEHGLTVLAGPNRDPLITTHCESGVKCVVDLRHTFFTPRMAAERLRLCQQVTGRNEHVLALFSGVGMDALQIASRTDAATVTAIELNPIAVSCALRAHALLERNRSIPRPGAAGRLKIVEGDVLHLLPTLPRDFYHRVICPRPKEGATDGDLGDGTGGEAFLNVILPVMKQRGGECHWYEFCSEPEFPECARSRALLDRVCQSHGVELAVLRIVAVGSVAMRQLRVCIDFRIEAPSV